MKEKKQALVPEVRFPEFSGEWEKVTLNKYLTPSAAKNRNGTFSKQDVLSVSGEFGIVNQIKFQGRSFAGESVENYGIVDTHDIVYTKSPLKSNPYGIIKTNKGPAGIVSTLYAVYKCSRNVDSNFVQYYFELDSRLNSYLEPLVRKGAKNDMKVSAKNALLGDVIFPSLPEQKKIAECLSSVDESIKAEDDRLQSLKDHKKGLMQKLFPKKGQTIPKVRFLGFSGDWEVKTLEEVFDLRNGYTPSKGNPEYWGNGTIPWFRMEDIRENGHILADAIQHITPEAIKGGGLFKKGSFILATTATIGEHALLIADSLANQRFTNLQIRESQKDNFETMYLYYYLFIVDEYCKMNVNQGGFYSVDMPSLRNCPIPFPSLPEQQKIADCLSSLDDEIAAQQQKVDALKEHKKGLMQKMFPKVSNN